ncbi:MAG: hypothetical protein J6Q78_01655 [Clostridia bacterium]|nr:hypothetical protein [Clostridia bacterium]
MENEEKIEKTEVQRSKNTNRGILIAIVATVLCLAIILTFVLCSSPYEYEEIEDRFKELVEASWYVNRILFGVGAETHPRVYDPRENTKTYLIEDQLLYYYFEIEDENYERVFAYREHNSEKYKYMEVTSKKKEDKLTFDYRNREKNLWGYIIENYNPTDISEKTETEYISEVLYYYYDVVDESDKRIVAFRSSNLDPFEYMEITKEEKSGKEYDYYDETAKVYGYILPDYNETKYQLYYKKSDPKDYDYVNGDVSGMRSVMDIKNFAETVYSKNYLENTIYETLFDGVATLNEEYLTGRTARYYEYTNSNGETWLMMSNTYEAVISDERPIFDYSTAEIVRPYRRNFVNVEIEYYYESDPSEIYTVKISMIMQDGVWMLDGQTF